VTNLVESFTGIVKCAQVESRGNIGGECCSGSLTPPLLFLRWQIGSDVAELKGRAACEHLGTEIHSNKLVPSPSHLRSSVDLLLTARGVGIVQVQSAEEMMMIASDIQHLALQHDAARQNRDVRSHRSSIVRVLIPNLLPTVKRRQS
jgi:hypothetical protein